LLKRTNTNAPTDNNKAPVTPSIQLITPQSSAKFNKKIADLPLHVDFPRLFSLTTIIGEDGNRIWEQYRSEGENKAPAKTDHFYQFFIILSQKLKQSEDYIKNSFFDFIPQGLEINNNDIPSNLKNFLNSLGEDNGIVGVLKCINQDIIVPAVTFLKFTLFMAKLNYFEIRGKWEIVIEFKDDGITITNRRWERSHPELFNFCWEITFFLNKEATALQNTKIEITDIEFVKEIPDEEKSKYITLLNQVNKPIN